MKTKTRKTPLVPSGGNDRVYTPDYLARFIVSHFRPCGDVLEPCSGGGAFTRAIGDGCYECEIDRGTDFFDWVKHVDWIMTNPPWGKFRAFLKHSMEVADNVVFLSLVNAWFMKARQRDIEEAGFGIVEIVQVPTPPKPWPQVGMCLGATWLRRGWRGSINMTKGYIDMKSVVRCMACGDTGLNSRGDLCGPCQANKREPLREGIMSVVTRLFDDAKKENRIPTHQEVRDAMEWALSPKVQYAAGFRDTDGSMGMFAGPEPDPVDLYDSEPPKDRTGRKAFIVRMVRTTFKGEPTIEPVARWHKGQWQRKKVKS